MLLTASNSPLSLTILKGLFLDQYKVAQKAVHCSLWAKKFQCTLDWTRWGSLQRTPRPSSWIKGKGRRGERRRNQMRWRMRWKREGERKGTERNGEGKGKGKEGKRRWWEGREWKENAVPTFRIFCNATPMLRRLKLPLTSRETCTFIFQQQCIRNICSAYRSDSASPHDWSRDV